MGDTRLEGVDEGGVLKGDGVLTGLAGGVITGDLTIGAGGAGGAGREGGATTASLNGFSRGFTVASAHFSAPFSKFLANFFGFTSSFFSLSFLGSRSIFLSLTIAFDSIFGFVALSVKGKIVGAHFLFVTPSGVSLMFFLKLGVLGSSVKVLSLSESTSNESSALAKIPAPNVSGANSSVPGGSTFLYGVPGL